jgi:hypothetical protein
MKYNYKQRVNILNALDFIAIIIPFWQLFHTFSTKFSDFLGPATIDEIVKSRYSRAGGNPDSVRKLKRLDSRFQGNHGIAHFSDFLRGHQPLVASPKLSRTVAPTKDPDPGIRRPKTEARHTCRCGAIPLRTGQTEFFKTINP